MTEEEEKKMKKKKEEEKQEQHKHKKHKNKNTTTTAEEEKGNEGEDNSHNNNKKNINNGIVKEGKNDQEKTEAEEGIRKNNNKRRKRKEQVFPFGNYRNYYGYRIAQGTEEDPRLGVFNKEWFGGKDCLDIGCNSGIITIHIATKFHCRKILGIDIDSDRIADAYWHLRKFVRAGCIGKTSAKASKLEVADKFNGSVDSEAPSSVEREEISKYGLCPEERDLFDIVSFRKENFVLSRSQPEEQYDTILCLSVTKWIHLNWGDDGLITLFSKIWKLLRPGGILVLEPQPWRSYENNRSVSETTSMNYRTIIFRPHCFSEILLDKIGFRKVEDISSALSGSKVGFDRPIFVYHK